MQPDQFKVEPIYYRSPMVDLHFGLSCIFGFVIGLFLIVITLTNDDLLGIIFVWGCEAAVIVSIFSQVSEVATKQEGLKVRYFLRRSRLITWDRIHEVAVRQGQGSWLIIRHNAGLLGVISFPVNYGLTIEKPKIDRLLSIIASSANLTLTGYTFVGSPIYKRVKRGI